MTSGHDPGARGSRGRGPTTGSGDGRVLLALETTGDGASVALADGARVLTRSDVDTRAATSELVMHLVDDLLRRTGVSPDALGLLAASRGPGAFTGIRVGLATVRGLSLGWGVPAVSVTSLDALSVGFGVYPGPVVTLLDARRGQVYARAEGSPSATGARQISPVSLLDPGDLGGLASRVRAKAGDATVLVVGSGVTRYPDAVADAFPGAWCPPELVPDAVGVVRAVRAGRVSEELDPLYVRPPDARLPGPQAVVLPGPTGHPRDDRSR